MSKYNIKDEVGKNFIKVKALAFFRNFIINHNSTIFNEDFFEVFIDETFYETTSFEDSVAVTVRKKIIQILKSELDAALLKKIVKFSIDNKENAKRFLLYAWNLCDNRDAIRNKLLEVSGESLERCDIFNKDKEVFELRLEELCRIMKLSGIESDILLLSFLFREHFLNTPDLDFRRGCNSAEFVEFVGKYLDYPVMELTRLMNAQGKLRRYDCLDKELRLNDSVLEFLYGFNTELFSDNYFKQIKNETLPWAFYGKLSETHGKILKRIIKENSGARGINILLYGEPGTGKTSFAQSLAAELKLTCYSISQRPGNEGLSSRAELRFGALQICDGQIDNQDSIIVIDECDEMLRGGGGNLALLRGDSMRNRDKGMLNAVLDTVKTPCIWIANIPAESLDASSRRRFDYSIRFDKLTFEQRLAIWRNGVEKFKLGRVVPSSLQEKFAAKYEVSAGGITLVLQNIAGLNLKKAEVE